MPTLIDTYFRFLKGLLTVLMALLTVPVLLQIFSRYLPFLPRYIWTEELARFAFIWIVLVGSSIAVREGTHFRVDILPTLSPRTERGLQLVYFVLMLVAAAVFAVAGWELVEFGLPQLSEITGLPMWTIFIAWPLAGVSWAVFLIEQLYAHFHPDLDADLGAPQPGRGDGAG